MNQHQYCKQVQELSRAMKSIVDTLLFDQFKKEGDRKISQHDRELALDYFKVGASFLGEDVQL